LFEPLGIDPRKNANCESKEDQFAYLMNKGDHGKVWFLDPKGMPTAGWDYHYLPMKWLNLD